MKHPTILLMVILFASCKSQSAKDFKVFISDTSKTHYNLNEIDFSKSNSRLLNLPEIDNGVDSFELRIWYWGFGAGNRLIDLRYVKSKWISYTTKYFSSNIIVDAPLDSAFTKALDVPKDIDSIVKYFSSDSILKLPSQQAIPNFVDNIGDGQGCRIEISSSKFYKALYYHCPEHYSDRYNKKFLEAVLFLDNYFKFYTPWCKPVS